jgi:hypothetical protein
MQTSDRTIKREKWGRRRDLTGESRDNREEHTSQFNRE